MTVYTGDGKVLIAWDMGCGPTWAYDPLGKPIKEKFLGTCEVWRSSDGQAAVNLGETSAEAFLDDQIGNLKSVTYWIMENVKGGGQRQIGPVIDVVVAPPRLQPDATPPSPPNELRCRRKAGGNELSWLASVDDESGVLAYFVYSANDHQPDAVLWVNEDDPLDRPAYGEGEDPSEEEAALGETDPVWQIDENGDPIIDEWGNRKAKEHARIKWLDRTTDGNKPYILRAIDNALNLSDPTGRCDPWTGLPPDDVPRWPVQPVVPEDENLNFIHLRINYVNPWNDGLLVATHQPMVVRLVQTMWIGEGDPFSFEETLDIPFNEDLVLNDLHPSLEVLPDGEYNLRVQYPYGADQPHIHPSDYYQYTLAFQWAPSLYGLNFGLWGQGPDHPYEAEWDRMHDVYFALAGSIHGPDGSPVGIWPGDTYYPGDCLLPIDGHVKDAEHLAQLQDKWDTVMGYYSPTLSDAVWWNTPHANRHVTSPDDPNHDTYPDPPTEFVLTVDSWSLTLRRPSYVGQLATDVYGVVAWDDFDDMRDAINEHADALWGWGDVSLDTDGMRALLSYWQSVER